MPYSLSEFQKQFSKAILQNQCTEELLQDIVPAGKLKNPQAVLSVHRRGYIAALTEQLGETFEAVWWALGDEEFLRASEQYIFSHPWESYNLIHYGEEFPDYLQKMYGTKIPFLKDLAHFEWQFRTVFHLLNNEPIGEDKIKLLQSGSRVRLILTPSLNFSRSEFAIYSLWKQREGKADGKEQIDIDQSENCLLYKKNHQVFIYVIESSALDLIEFLSKFEGAYQDCLEIYSQKYPVSPQLVQNVFQVLIQENLIIDLIEI